MINAKEWTEYVETEEDKKIYLPKVKEEANTPILKAKQEVTSEGPREAIEQLSIKINEAGSREAGSREAGSREAGSREASQM